MYISVNSTEYVVSKIPKIHILKTFDQDQFKKRKSFQ